MWIFWQLGNVNLAEPQSHVSLFCSLVQMDMMTWPRWTLVTVLGLRKALCIPGRSQSDLDQTTSCSSGWQVKGGASLAYESHPPSPQLFTKYLLAQIQAASGAVEEWCSYSSDTMRPQNGNSSTFAFFCPKKSLWILTPGTPQQKWVLGHSLSKILILVTSWRRKGMIDFQHTLLYILTKQKQVNKHTVLTFLLHNLSKSCR